MIYFLMGLMNLFLGTCIILLIIVILRGLNNWVGMMINKGVGIIWDHTVAGKFETFY